MTDPPQNFAERPPLADAALRLGGAPDTLDLLSQLLRNVRLLGDRIVAYSPTTGSTVRLAAPAHCT